MVHGTVCVSILAPCTGGRGRKIQSPGPLVRKGGTIHHVDGAVAAELIGVRLKSYKTLATERGVSAMFEFENSRKLLINDVDGCTSYEVI